MPTVNGILVGLDGDREVYRPGDTVSGWWTVDLGESFSVRGIRTALQGAAYTRWQPLSTRKDPKISYENITTQWCTVFGRESGDNGPNHTIAAGVHQYRFSFRLPTEFLPSSYEGEYGAIRYWLALQIDRPLLRFNIDRFKIITVLDHIDVNAPEFSRSVCRQTEEKISKAFGLGNRGSVSLTAKTDRGAYCPGEKIAVSLFAKNDSDKDLGLIKAVLVQRTTFVAADEDRTSEMELKQLIGKTPLLKGTDRTWTDGLIGIDAVPPSTRERTSHIVKVSYFVKVTVGLSLLQGDDITLHLPITIGTVPQGFGQTSSGTAVSDPTELNLSSLITYTQCNKGFEYFTKSSPDFPEYEYQPWCAYVPNFQYRASTSVGNASQGPPTTSPSSRIPTTYPSTSATADTATVHVPQAPLDSARETTSLVQQSTRILGSGSGNGANAVRRKTFAVLRFLDSVGLEFRQKLADHKEVLMQCGGTLIALATKVTVNKGHWPSGASIAVFLFNNDEGANKWFEEYSKVCKQSGFDILDAVIGATKGSIQSGKDVYSLTLTKKIDSANFLSPEWNRYITLAGTHLASLRKEKGGVRFTDTKQRRINWSDPNCTITITQWNSEKQLYQFDQAIETDDRFQELRELRGLFFTVETAVVFQTEDLAFMEKAITKPSWNKET